MTTRRLLFIAIGVLLIAASGGGAPAGRAAARQSIWLHYDYLVMPDGTSLAPDPRSIQLVVDAFAAHGIDLHVDQQHTALPYHALLDVENSVPIGGCPGLGLGPHDIVEFEGLKAQYFHPTANHEWHYAVFGDLIDCGGSSGYADLPGDDLVVSLGRLRRSGIPITPYREGGTFMHELGHNLGLSHGGRTYPVNINFESNYLSVMNYRFQFGIPYAAAPGSTSIAGWKLDYSEEALPTLDESHLDETAGLGATLPSDRTDITHWTYPISCGDCPLVGNGSASGPIDWNGDGSLASDVAVDLDNGFNTFQCGDFPLNDSTCGVLELFEQQQGFDDWAWIHAYLAGQVNPGPKTFEHENRAAEPIVASISPASGPAAGGTPVTITGTHFEKATAVAFGGEPATSFSILNDGTITAVSPPTSLADGGTFDVTVVSGHNPSPSVDADTFSYAPWAAPSVDSIAPQAGPLAGGTAVTISGSHLTGASVSFKTFPGGDTAGAAYTVLDDGTIRAVSPFIGGYETYSTVTVSNPAGTANTVFAYVAAPAVQSISPATGFETGGRTVTINLVNCLCNAFGGPAGVFFGSKAATSFTFAPGGSTISAVTPPGSGTVDVTVANAGGTSATVAADLFSYVPTAAITALTPDSGPGGTVVTITGQHLGNATDVDFGGSSVSFTVIDDSTLVATAPSRAAPGTVPVTVVTPDGTTAPVDYTYPS